MLSTSNKNIEHIPFDPRNHYTSLNFIALLKQIILILSANTQYN